MKVKDLKKILKVSSSILTKDPIVPITAYALISDGKIYTTNLHDWIVQPVDIKGEFLVPVSLLMGVVNASGGGYNVDIKDGIIVIGGKYRHVYEKEITADFPSLKPGDLKEIGHLSKYDVDDAKKMVPFTSLAGPRPAMNFINFDSSIAATDGNRLFVTDRIGGSGDFLVPGKLIKIIPSYDYKVLNDGNVCKLESKECDIYYRWDPSDVIFPDYKSVWPESDPVSIISGNHLEWKEMVDNALVSANKITHMARFIFKGNKVQVSSGSLDLEGFDYKSSLSKTGKDGRIAFNGRSLKDIIKIFGDIEMKYYADNKAAIFNDTILLMPLLEQSEWT